MKYESENPWLKFMIMGTFIRNNYDPSCACLFISEFVLRDAFKKKKLHMEGKVPFWGGRE